MNKAKPFEISQDEIRDAFKRVKANKGAAGVDGESIAEFERNLERNLYRIWNRMSSGTYMPPPVKCVEIPKDGGRGVRRLGVPTVADRVAQMVVKMQLEPLVEPIFHEDSYGYRPGKSAHDAIGTARKRCWKTAWVVDLDIRGFFDNLDHSLVIKAVKQHTSCRWILLYIERWLKAPVELQDGTLELRKRGSPQGSVVSPLISNIVMHHVFDEWLRNNFPIVGFERYADDALLHCISEQQAKYVRDAVAKRLARFGLELNTDKTRIVYCKREGREGSYEHERFDFLGYTFRPRLVRNHEGSLFVSFSPAISNKATKAIRETIRAWKLHLHTSKSLSDLAKFCNPQLRGWINYYGRYHKSALYSVFLGIESRLIKWAQRKYKRLRTSPHRAWQWWAKVRNSSPALFAHWTIGKTQWSSNGSRMS